MIVSEIKGARLKALKTMIETYGGSILKSKDKSALEEWSDDIIIFADQSSKTSKNINKWKKIGFNIYKTDMIATCILRQKLDMNDRELKKYKKHTKIHIYTYTHTQK